MAHREAYQDASLPVIHTREFNAGRARAWLPTFYRVMRETGETRERRAQRHAAPHVLGDRHP
ncbi:MAG: hypothetical protein WBG92_02275 [Thiohalocapsa sp.]